MDRLSFWHLSDENIDSDIFSHHTFPGFNLLSAEILREISKDLSGTKSDDDTDYLGSFPFYQPFPYAVQSSFLFCGSRLIDDATKLVERKFNWEEKLRSLRPSNIDAVIKTFERLKQNKKVKLSKAYKKYIDYFHEDPAPMFSGNYNWLYTGGCLCQNEKFNGTCLISGDFNSKPGFNFLLLNETQDKILQKSFHQLKSSLPVLQITCRPHTENLIICVRQKKYLSLFNANQEIFQPVGLWRKKVPNTKLLTSADVEANCEKVIVTDSNHDINIFHLERRNKIYGCSSRNMESDGVEDAWNQIEFGDLGIYWALRNRFVIFDLRDFYWGSKLNYELPSIMNPCEKIFSFAKSQSDPNFIYLSTTHGVLQVDLRKGEAVQKWTHLMKHPPQFMAVVKDKEESELLLLQSPSVGKISGIINERVKSSGSVNFVSKSLPCLLNSVKDSLNLARFHGVCLSPSVANRVDFSVTGIQCLKNNQGDLNLFTTNSGGDIFLSKIKSKVSNSFCEEENEKEVIKGMESYESDLKKLLLKKKSFNSLAYKITDKSFVLKDLQHSKVKRGKKKEPKIKSKFDEMYEFKNLSLFQDPLTQKILQVWIPYEERVDGMDLEAEMNALEARVTEWAKAW